MSQNLHAFRSLTSQAVSRLGSARRLALAAGVSALVLSFGTQAIAQDLSTANFNQTPTQTPDTGSAALANQPALTSNTPAPEVPALGEGMLVSVNEDMVTSYDLKQRMLLLIVTSGVQVTDENYASFQQQALRSLIDERLESQEMDHWKVKIEDKRVDEELDRMAKQSNMDSKQLLSELKRVGVEPATLRAQIKAQVGWNDLVGGRFHANASVGKGQVDAMMDKIIEDGQKPQYQVGEIFLDPAVAGSIENAQKGAQQLYEQISNKVAPFQAVARQFSNAPSGANGGDEGWLVSGNIDPQIERVLNAMKPGELSTPITTKEGVYIFYLRQKSDGHGDMVVRLKQAAVPLPANASANDVAAAQSLLASFRTRAATCSAVDDLNTKASTVKVTDLGETELSTLQPAYAEALRPLKEGQATQPLRNAQNVNMLYVCDKRMAGDDAMTRDQLENQLVNQRLAMLGKRYLRDLRNTATIENHQ